jgi:hypothetical protein
MSTKTVAGSLLVTEKSACVMVTFNLAYHEEECVFDYWREHGKVVLLKKALALDHICNGGNNQDPVQTSMNFIFANAGVTSAIVGTIDPKHLRGNVDKAIRAITQLHKPLTTENYYNKK